jgi:mannuronan synthase
MNFIRFIIIYYMTKKKTLSNYLNWLAILLIWVGALSGLYIIHNQTTDIALSKLDNIIFLGVIGIWRWSWLLLHIIRSFFYRVWVFPRWRRKAARIPLDRFPPLAMVVPTYKEKPWITERVFQAIVREAKTLNYPLVLLVTSTAEENKAIAKIIESVDPESRYIRLIQMVQKDGKRKAMADALKRLATLNLPADTVVALMDGDSEITPGTVRQCLPFFRLFPKMGGLTTDELPLVNGSDVFSEWFHLRFAQRHYIMSSLSLSKKVLCLTGRFSLFRSEAALDPTFAQQLENDTLDDWLWGKFKFLSGDDKSTWYWLLQRGYQMIYVPDVIVYSIETISGSVIDRAYQNMRRWYGNMLRTSDRALALGPIKTGWFIWWCLLDQRISIWTTLITPCLMLIALIQGSWLTSVILILWVLLTRPFLLTVIFWRRKSHLKLIHLPLLIASQWGSSVVKVWTQMNLAQQKWANRGNQSISAAGGRLGKWIKGSFSQFLLFTQTFSFVVFLLWQYGTLSVAEDVSGWWWYSHVTPQAVPTQIISAIEQGVYPSDRADDSKVLQAIIDNLPPTGVVQIDLPMGEIDLFQPLEINRSNTFIVGKGTQGTVLLAHPQALLKEAVITVKPKSDLPSNTIKNIHLSGFSINPVGAITSKSVPSIVLKNTAQAVLKNLHLNNTGDRALVLSKTEDVKVEYMAIDGVFAEKAIETIDAVNTQLKGIVSFGVSQDVE